MRKWIGAAGVCVNNNEILMIKQGKPEERKTWAIPSGGHEVDETIEQCCVRELSEETGYDVEIKEKLFIKQDVQRLFEVEVHYFRVEIIGGSPTIQDPDHLIYEIDWKTFDEIDELELSYPQDRKMIQRFLTQGVFLNK